MGLCMEEKIGFLPTHQPKRQGQHDQCECAAIHFAGRCLIGPPEWKEGLVCTTHTGGGGVLA